MLERDSNGRRTSIRCVVVCYVVAGIMKVSDVVAEGGTRANLVPVWRLVREFPAAQCWC